MTLIANIVVALVGRLHVHCRVRKTLLWQMPVGPRAFGPYRAVTASRKRLFVQALPSVIGLVRVAPG